MKKDKKRKIDTMTDQDIADCFMANFDCYADCPDVVPAMSKERYLKMIAELTKDIEQ